MTLLTIAALSGLIAEDAFAKGKPTKSSIAYPADFELQTCWGFSSFDPACPWTENVMHANGDFEQTWLHFDGLAGSPFPITFWGEYELRKGGKQLVVTFEDTYVTTTWTGSKTTDGCFAGTVENTSGQTGVWEGCVVP